MEQINHRLLGRSGVRARIPIASTEATVEAVNEGFCRPAKVPGAP